MSGRHRLPPDLTGPLADAITAYEASALTVMDAVGLVDAASRSLGAPGGRRTVVLRVLVGLAGAGVLVCAGTALAFTLHSGVLLLAALVTAGLVTGIATSLHLPGRITLHAGLLLLGGIGRIPVSGMLTRPRLRQAQAEYARRRLTAAQLETFTVLAPDYGGTARELITAARTLT